MTATNTCAPHTPQRDEFKLTLPHLGLLQKLEVGRGAQHCTRLFGLIIGDGLKVVRVHFASPG